MSNLGYRLADSVPCPQGHTRGRNKSRHCRECRKIANKRRQVRPAWLIAEGLIWIGYSHRSLRKRADAGEKVASKRQLHAKWLAQAGCCALTGIPLGDTVPHLDHIVPKSKGGGHTIDNLHWTDPAANMAKLDKSVDEFREWLLSAADRLRARLELEKLF